MRVVLKNGEYDTNMLYKQLQRSTFIIEECTRLCIVDVPKYPVGFIIPLGTLSNAAKQDIQFYSNFNIIAYTVSDGVIDRERDFDDLNIMDNTTESGRILELIKRLDKLAFDEFGPGWRLTIHNVKMSMVINSMCKNNTSVEMIEKASNELFEQIATRVGQLKASTPQNRWKHEMVELFYAPLRALSVKFTKFIDRRAKRDKREELACNSLVIEALVYDTFANGLRLLANVEDFTSTKIRMRPAVISGNKSIRLNQPNLLNKPAIPLAKNDTVNPSIINRASVPVPNRPLRNNVQSQVDDDILDFGDEVKPSRQTTAQTQMQPQAQVQMQPQESNPDIGDVSLDDTIFFVLKARVRGEPISFRPIRQFKGQSKTSLTRQISGCTERIIYNTVNKNYRHWSFVSLAPNLHVDLNDILFKDI